MQQKIIKKLLELNEKFYDKAAEEFSLTRQYFQPGWQEMIDIIKQTHDLPARPSVLDLGCGNGRFVDFLKTQIPNFVYLGVDGNKKLIEISKKRYQNKLIKFQIKKIDTFTTKNKYDLIACLAVLHHIPGYVERLKLIKRLLNYLNPKGFLTLSLWKFLNDPRIRQRIVPWKELSAFKISLNEVEQGDFLLPWGNNNDPLRYCHNFTEEEISLLKKDLAKYASVLSEFSNDGKDGKLNTYIILSKA